MFRGSRQPATAGNRRLRAEGRGDPVMGNTKQAGAKVKDAFRH